MHKVVDGHDTPLSGWVPSMLWAAPHVPLAGSVDASAFPDPSTATHKLADGHDTPLSEWGASMGLAVPQVPDAGLVELTTLPDASTITHKPEVGQDRPFGKLPASTAVAVQAGTAASGFVEVNTFPLGSTARQS